MLAASEIGAEAPFSMGTQLVDPVCFVREHVHPKNEKVTFVLEGSGEGFLDGVDKLPMVKSTCIFLGRGRGRAHRFEASKDAPMTFMWLMMPGGLDTLFARIGRERQPGHPQPANCPRPAGRLRIEAQTVFGTLPTKSRSRFR